MVWLRGAINAVGETTSGGSVIEDIQRAGHRAGTISGSTALGSDRSSDGNRPSVSTGEQSERMVTVHLREIDDILYNPGMGLTDFHFGFGHPPPVEEYPHATGAYFRWPWAELEPAEGQYNFALVDRVIEQAKAKGETLAIRIVSEYKTNTAMAAR